MILALFGMASAFTPRPAQAQQATGVLGWNQNGVYYPTAREACIAQWQQYGMHLGASQFVGDLPGDFFWSRRCSWTSYQWGCLISTNPAYPQNCGTILPSGVSFECAYGYVRAPGEQCIPTYRGSPERCEVCNNGNSGSSSGNGIGGFGGSFGNNGGSFFGSLGDPVSVQSGAVFRTDVDFSSDDGRFILSRSYSSKPGGGSDYSNGLITNLGGFWSFDFAWELQIAVVSGSVSSPLGKIALMSPSGQAHDFNMVSGGSWTPSTLRGPYYASTTLKLEFLGTYPTNLWLLRNATSQWRMTDGSDTVWIFQTFKRANPSASADYYTVGRPTSRTWRDGYVWNFSYNADGTLATITDSYGRSASFAWRSFYYPNGPAGALPLPEAVAEVTLPDQTKLAFTYDPPPSGGPGPPGTQPIQSTGVLKRLTKVERTQCSLGSA